MKEVATLFSRPTDVHLEAAGENDTYQTLRAVRGNRTMDHVKKRRYGVFIRHMGVEYRLTSVFILQTIGWYRHPAETILFEVGKTMVSGVFVRHQRADRSGFHGTLWF